MKFICLLLGLAQLAELSNARPVVTEEGEPVVTDKGYKIFNPPQDDWKNKQNAPNTNPPERGDDFTIPQEDIMSEMERGMETTNTVGQYNSKGKGPGQGYPAPIIQPADIRGLENYKPKDFVQHVPVTTTAGRRNKPDRVTPYEGQKPGDKRLMYTHKPGSNTGRFLQTASHHQAPSPPPGSAYTKDEGYSQGWEAEKGEQSTGPIRRPSTPCKRQLGGACALPPKSAPKPPINPPGKPAVQPPVKAPTNPPGQPPAKTTVKPPFRPPGKSPVSSSVNPSVPPSVKAPAKTPPKAPAKTLPKTPPKIPAKAPPQIPAKTPPKIPAKIPAKAPPKAPAKAPIKPPFKPPGKKIIR